MAGRQQNGDHDWLEWGPRRPQAALWGSLRLQQQAHSTGAISAISHLQSRHPKHPLLIDQSEHGRKS